MRNAEQRAAYAAWARAYYKIHRVRLCKYQRDRRAARKRAAEAPPENRELDFSR